MAVEIPMPHLSQTTEEVKLIRWLVKEGDKVQKGQALCEVENDKTTMEVESFASGTVLRLNGEPESMIAAGTLIAVLGEAGEQAQAAPVRPDAASPPGPQAASSPHPAQPASPPAAQVRATPLVRNLAAKRGVDLAQVRGTGAQGLVTRADLDTYLRGASARPGAAGPGAAPGPATAAAPAAARRPAFALSIRAASSRSMAAMSLS